MKESKDQIGIQLLSYYQSLLTDCSYDPLISEWHHFPGQCFKLFFYAVMLIMFVRSSNIVLVLQQCHTYLTDQVGIPVWGSYIIFGLVTLLSGLTLGLVRSHTHSVTCNIGVVTVL